MLIYAILILSGLLARPLGADDVWLEPNAWEIHSPSPNTCPVCDIPDVTNEMGITTMYYKQMIAQLFNRNNLKVNPKTGHLERTLILSLTAAQLKILENSSDIRDFNSAVMAIITSAKEPYQEANTSQNKGSLFWLFEYIWESVYFTATHLVNYIWGSVYSMATHLVNFLSYVYFNNSEAQFAVFVGAVMMAIWFIHKRYNKNLIFILIVSFIMLGYFCTYIECNRKLETEEYIQFIKENEPDEPNYFSKFLGNIFKSSKKEQKIQRIKNESKVNLGFCRPDDVAIMYFNRMFFNQLQLTIEKIVESMNTIRDTIPFPFNYMGMLAVPFLFMSLLPLLFQYIFNPVSWYKIFRLKANQHQQGEMINNNAPQGDRLSGDNLKILFEVLKNKTEVDENPKNSAVEDVKDVPLPITAKLDDSLSAEEASEDITAVKIEDILEDATFEKES